jgi:hypothetical protein
MKLIQTGQWYWRHDEISLKQFSLLTSTDKQEYLDLLKGLKPNELSSTDIIILNKFAPAKPKQTQFLEL